GFVQTSVTFTCEVQSQSESGFRSTAAAWTEMQHHVCELIMKKGEVSEGGGAGADCTACVQSQSESTSREKEPQSGERAQCSGSSCAGG
ncbi:hypothetical protein NQZ68_034873, partial [Dissostichus eleginoides]